MSKEQTLQQLKRQLIKTFWSHNTAEGWQKLLLQLELQYLNKSITLLQEQTNKP